MGSAHIRNFISIFIGAHKFRGQSNSIHTWAKLILTAQIKIDSKITSDYIDTVYIISSSKLLLLILN